MYKFKGQTNELQGISFKLGDHKYKGSEIDRKFSVLNLQKEIYNQHLSQSHRFEAGMHLSPSLSQRKSFEPHKEFKKQKTLLNELMKPEKQPMNVAADFRTYKPKKKKSRGLHL